MTMTVFVAQARIARELIEAEQAVEEALLRQSRLFTSMVAARRDLNMAGTFGQDALLRLAKSQQSLLTAGNDLARVHGRMRDIDQEITGDLASDCPAGAPTKPGVSFSKIAAA